MNSHILTEFKNKRVFGGLDGLRFISIAAVVWHHSVSEVSWFKVGKYGFLGVDLFFLISGFLIVSLLLRERDKIGDISLRDFYIRRSLRIFPLYYGLILGLAFLYYFFAKDSEYGQQFIGELPIYLLYLANFFPVAFAITWSLASEEQFYLIWPFIEKYCAKFIFWVLALTLAVNQAVNFFHIPMFSALGVPHWSNNNIVQATFTPIILGVVLAHMLHKNIGARYLLPLIQQRFASIGWFVLLMGVLIFAPEDISGAPRLALQCLMLLLIGSVVLREDNYFNPFLNFKPFARIGVVSYGVYLFHIHCIEVAKKILEKVNIDNELAVFVLAIALSVFLAELSFRLFESHFLKLKSKFSVVHQKHT